MTDVLAGVITPMIVGVVLIVIGIVNMTGNISSIHSYHRKYVTEENRKPFGKKVGLGTLIIGVGVIVLSVMMYLADKFENDLFMLLGTMVVFIAVAVGLIISLSAIKKYNGGIFKF